MTEERKVGELLDSLGITLELDDREMTSDALVVAKTIDEDGQVAITIGKSESMTWLDQIGMVTAASDIIRQGFTRKDEE